MRDHKHCRTCDTTKPISLFGVKTVKGRKYPRTQCQRCETTKGVKRDGVRERSKSPDDRKAWFARRYAREALLRCSTNLVDIAKIILIDSRGSDRKSKRVNDLDRNFIHETIKSGCAYCGETGLRMTLDRIDNNVGHIKTNVVPACIRCNYVRRDMPYAAWIAIAPSMEAARSQGLFGEWTGRVRWVAGQTG